MKVELVREKSLTDGEWFSIYVNGQYKTGSSHEFKTKKLYFHIISEPSILETNKEILHSAEFIVASEYKK
jgi:hypothetical protein